MDKPERRRSAWLRLIGAFLLHWRASFSPLTVNGFVKNPCFGVKQCTTIQKRHIPPNIVLLLTGGKKGDASKEYKCKQWFFHCAGFIDLIVGLIRIVHDP